MSTTTQERPLIEWGWAGAALKGDESGDLQVVALLPHGALAGVIDGLGHGPEAAVAAREAGEILRAHATLPVQELFELCHEGLRKTRGAVMSLASLDVRSSTIDWCGVGNVEGALLRVTDTGAARKREGLCARGGVVGYRLPALKVATISVSRGDVLLLASDGIRSGFAEAVDPRTDVRVIADTVLAQWTNGSDDALVLAVRYLGRAP
jgi:negative regulator of sigma-B (phosphoserine phosphatase)